MPKCPDCHTTYPDDGGGHCRGGSHGGCCQTFASDQAFDAHRRGKHGINRHCLDVQNDPKWRLGWHGWTNRPAWNGPETQEEPPS